MRLVALDPEVLMVAGHRPERRAERRGLAHEELVVARRFAVAHAKCVAHEIARDDEKGRCEGVDECAESAGAVDACRGDVGVGRVDEAELARAGRWCEGEGELRRRITDGAPETPYRAIAVGDGDEDDAGAAARQVEAARRVGGGDGVLVGDGDAGNAALTGVVNAVAVGVDKDGAGGLTLRRRARRAGDERTERDGNGEGSSDWLT